MIAVLVGALILFALAYRFYGSFLERTFNVRADASVPSVTMRDGIDYEPARTVVVLGHHFSSIAGAGPIVGPIIAGFAFGWLPALAWIVLGAILVGGVHDYSALMISLRSKGRSIAQVARDNLSRDAHRLFLVFIWLVLVYVIVVFADLCASTFDSDPGVATSGGIYVMLALGFGVAVYRMRVSVLPATSVFVPLVFFGIWLGQQYPAGVGPLAASLGLSGHQFWLAALLAYCFVASVLPVWFLLQPRDYLSSYLLYASLLLGVLGIVGGGFAITHPAFVAFSASGLGPLFPILFITVACGACSGFHSIVASGTSSKQLSCEPAARAVGYGAMLIEGVLAVIALATVMVLPVGAAMKDPLAVFGAGAGRFAATIGLPESLGVSFGLLAISTFILTTLDTCTRLARFILAEFVGVDAARSRFWATAATLVLPTVLVFIKLTDASGQAVPAWKAVWPVFGATNQLLAGLALLVAVVWLRATGRRVIFAALPMAFMVVMTVTALVMLVARYLFVMTPSAEAYLSLALIIAGFIATGAALVYSRGALRGAALLPIALAGAVFIGGIALSAATRAVAFTPTAVGVIAVVLLSLAVLLVVEAARVLTRSKTATAVSSS